MSEENKALVRRMYDEVLGGKNLDAVTDIIAAGMIDHEMGGNGPEGVRQTVMMFRAAFPDMSVEVHDIIAEGDKVAARVTFRGTHRGEFMGIAATDKPISLPVIDVLRIENGMIAEHWGISDNMAMMEQLGAAPSS